MKNRIYTDMLKARKEGNKEVLSALTLLWNEITNSEKSEGAITDEKVLALVRKMIKQDKETINGFMQRGDQDKVNPLEMRVAIYESYLPAQLDDEQLRGKILMISSGRSIKDMGAIMRELKPVVAGVADMSRVSAMLKDILNG